MNTEPDREFAALEAGLARLPQWQPPADFSARLAAAAARQQAQPVAPLPSMRQWLWAALPRYLPHTLGAGIAAVALARLPWSTVVDSPALPWVAACGAAVTGLTLTVQLLRSP